MKMGNQPLEGILVIDLTRILAGPYCTMMLGDMGARVIKVEMPKEGDDARHWGPPFIKGESAYFLSINRNKESLTLNFKKEKGKKILKNLVRKADVLVENFRPGTLEKFGLGYLSLKKENPKLIYCSISGFGQTGPSKDRPGYDLVIQGEGGIMSLTGSPFGPPFKVGVSMADIIAGMLAVQGILLALIVREKRGRGQYVDISLLDGQIALLAYQAGIYFATGKSPKRMGNLHPTIVPYETFKTKDGYINICVGNEPLWKKFSLILGKKELSSDPNFSTNALRLENQYQLRVILNKILKQKTTLEWHKILSKAGVPCGFIKSVEEVLNDPQVLAREMVTEIPHPKLGKLKLTGLPIKLSLTPGKIKKPPPLLGEHTEEVLSTFLGYGRREIALLQEEGVI